MAAIASRPAIARLIALRGALQLDAAVSGANGAAYLLAAGPLGDLLGMSPTLLRVLGAVLVGFAAAVWLMAARAQIPRSAALAAVAVNVAWALGSIAVAIGGWTSPTTVGMLWIVAQALVVAAFAELQSAALKR